ncbi:MAG: RNA-binding protein [Bacteroidetes bacterium]|jgi:hypothetical protein|nr:RNA-binding protein [Bacteroidota bacterium]
MKKILLSLFSIVSVAASAQTLTYANHAPAWGNAPYQTSQCDSVGVVPGASGAGAVWSFTPTNLHSSKTYTTSNTLPTNTLYPASNVSVYSSTSDVAYHNTNASSFKYYGGNLVINSYALSVVYSAPAIYAVYPMSLSTSTTAATSGTINLTSPFPVSQAFTGNCSVMADATGTLVLPAKTFTDVIRVATTQTITASAATVYQSNYDYYSVGSSKAPIFSIQTSTINVVAQPSSTQTVVYVQPNYSVVGVNEVPATAINLSVFPNPTSNFINFSTVSLEAVKVTALDMTGKVIANETIENGKSTINTASFSAGVYMYHVTDKNNRILTSGKFTVSK